MPVVDVAVIGRGIIGAAAARHLAEQGLAVGLIGPGEPEDRRAGEGPFCSHSDEGRITRVAGRSHAWAELAARSIERYGDIERRSSVSFHRPSGFVAAHTDAAEWVNTARGQGGEARLVEDAWVRETMGIALPPGIPALYEDGPSGHINPRRLVAAQSALAARAGAIVIDHAARSVQCVNGTHIVAGAWGTITAPRVLVATGAFGAELFEWQLDVERRPRTTVMAELAPDPRLPSLVCDRPPDDRVHEIYWVPPVTYPDGSVRIKIGGNLKTMVPLDTDDLVDWFHTDGDPTEVDCLTANLHALLPDALIGSAYSAPCVITGTPSTHPYIGWVDDGVAVAIAGNGSAAKSSDEIGRLGASLFSDDGWDSRLDAAVFTPVLR